VGEDPERLLDGLDALLLAGGGDIDPPLYGGAPGSRLAELLGEGRRRANSFHGQAVGEVGDGLRVVATAPDGVVEALEAPQRTFVVTMQWHPEMESSQKVVFDAYVKEGRAYRQRRGS
jgi:putative glutamine amidotransferase